MGNYHWPTANHINCLKLLFIRNVNRQQKLQKLIPDHLTFTTELAQQISKENVIL